MIHRISVLNESIISKITIGKVKILRLLMMALSMFKDINDTFREVQSSSERKTQVGAKEEKHAESIEVRGDFGNTKTCTATDS